jgi:hypothetical protein
MTLPLNTHHWDRLPGLSGSMMGKWCQALNNLFTSLATVHRDNPFLAQKPPIPTKQLQLIFQKITEPRAGLAFCLCPKAWQIKGSMTSHASGLSPACPKTTDLSIRVLTTISHKLEDSLHSQTSGCDPTGCTAFQDSLPCN